MSFQMPMTYPYGVPQAAPVYGAHAAMTMQPVPSYAPSPVVMPQVASATTLPTVAPGSFVATVPDADAPKWKHGDWVKLRGQAYDARYKNTVYQVEAPDVGDGRVHVSYTGPDGRTRKTCMAPGALEAADAPANASIATTAPEGSRRVKVNVPGVGPLQHLNGKWGTVLPPGYPDASGNVKVKLDEGQILGLPAACLEGEAGSAPIREQPTAAAAPAASRGVGAPQPAAPALSQNTGLGGFQVGDKVKITGLAGLSAHDGKTATIHSPNMGDGNLLVKVDEATMLSLKPSYLQPLNAPAAKTRDVKPTVSKKVSKGKAACC